MTSNAELLACIARCTFLATDRQAHLAQLHAEDDWEVDLDAQSIRFGQNVHYKVQLLGSESDVSNTWMWAWANKLSELPPKLFVAVNRLRQIGEEQGPKELTIPQFDLDVATGHELSMIASVLLKASAYFRTPYDDGAAFFLIMDPSFPTDNRRPLQRIVEALTHTLRDIEIEDHQIGLREYLHELALPWHEQGDRWDIEYDGQHLELKFDSARRLCGIHGAIS